PIDTSPHRRTGPGSSGRSGPDADDAAHPPVERALVLITGLGAEVADRLARALGDDATVRAADGDIPPAPDGDAGGSAPAADGRRAAAPSALDGADVVVLGPEVADPAGVATSLLAG